MTNRPTQEFPFTQIPNWVITHPDVTHAVFRVYAAIALHAGKQRTAWPGIRRINEEAHCSTTTVKAAVAVLEKLGALVVTRRFNEDGSRASNHYHLPMNPETLTATPWVSDEYTPGSVSDTEQHSDEPHPLNHTQLESEALTVEVIERDGETYQVEIEGDITPALIPEILDGGKDHHDAIAYALVDAMGWARSEVTEPQWGQIHKAALHLTNKGVHPGDVDLRARHYQLNHPDWELTPAALAKWWADSALLRQRPTRKQIEQIREQASRQTWRQHSRKANE